jgi:iron(III)-enterobactin esterase
MGGVVLQTVMVERAEIHSRYLNRVVLIDFYVPTSDALSGPLRLLLLNDGQDLPTIAFDALLSHLLQEDRMQPILCVGIHAGPERKMEYGTAHTPDFAGRGAKAKAYQDFLLLELLPHIQTTYPNTVMQQLAFGGFSLGGLMALDTVWQHPQLFSLAAVFSGSLWWRSKDLNNGYNEATDRIMHKQIRDGNYQAGQRFYLITGSLY